MDDRRKCLDVASAMGAVPIDDNMCSEEVIAAEQEAQRRWYASGRVAAWGCEWFARWKDNVRLAVERRQRLTVFFFSGQTLSSQAQASLASPGGQPAREARRELSKLASLQSSQVVSFTYAHLKQAMAK